MFTTILTTYTKAHDTVYTHEEKKDRVKDGGKNAEPLVVGWSCLKTRIPRVY